jgi:hypothetical protein
MSLETFARSIVFSDRTAPALFTAIDDRIVVIQNQLQKSLISADVFTFEGELVGRLRKMGVWVRTGTRQGSELVVAGEGAVARMDVSDLRLIERWNHSPKPIWAIARREEIVATASVQMIPDVVLWHELGTEPPRRVARLSVGAKDGWKRCPFAIHPAKGGQWWLFSEHRFALVDISGTKPRYERTIELDFIASQIRVSGTKVYALEVKGGKWQWRDGELRPAGSQVLGGSPSDPEDMADQAQLIRVDLETSIIERLGTIKTGLFVSDENGIAIVRPGAIDVLDGAGRIAETVSIRTPSDVLFYAEPSPYNWTATFGLRSVGPSELLMGPFVGTETSGELLHVAWGASAVERAKKRHN